MQNCDICDAKLGNIVNVSYATSEKTWLMITPCCNKMLCFHCLLKCSKTTCPLCDVDMMNTLPPSISRLTNMKIYPTNIIVVDNPVDKPVDKPVDNLGYKK
jgi:hypothetical protein